MKSAITKYGILAAFYFHTGIFKTKPTHCFVYKAVRNVGFLTIWRYGEFIKGIFHYWFSCILLHVQLKGRYLYTVWCYDEIK